jgi:hypothetical protein
MSKEQKNALSHHLASAIAEPSDRFPFLLSQLQDLIIHLISEKQQNALLSNWIFTTAETPCLFLAL